MARSYHRTRKEHGIALKTLFPVTVIFIIQIFVLTRFKSLTILAIIVLGLCLWLFFKQKKSIAWMSLVSMVFIIVSVYAKEQTYFSQHSVYDDGSLVATGEIISSWSQSYYLFKYDGRLFRYQSDESYQAGDIIWFSAELDTADPVPVSRGFGLDEKYRDLMKMRVDAILNRSFDHDQWLMMKSIHGVIYEENSILQHSAKLTTLQSIRFSIKRKIEDSLGSNPNASSLLAGLLLGDRSGLDDDVYKQFVDSGLVHIIAVSGGNIVLLVVLLSFLLFFLPFYVRTVLIMLAILIYAFLVGPDSSIVRASIMGLLTYLAVLRGRPVSIWRLVCYAIILMSLRNPYFLIADIGFVFSFAALIGIVSLSKLLQFSQKEDQTMIASASKQFRNGYMCPTISATMGVLPFLLLFTSSYNILSVISNAFILPLVPLVTILGLVSIGGFLPSFLLTIVDSLLSFILYVAKLTAQYGIYVELNHSWVAMSLILVIIGFLSFRLRKKVS